MTGKLLLAALLVALPIFAAIAALIGREARRGSLGTLIGTFLLGLGAAIPAVAIVLLASWVSLRSAWLAAAVAAFLITAIPEELLKLAVLLGYSARRPSFAGPSDGLVYGIAVALGFGALENALYIAQGGWATAILRAVTAVPMNAATGAVLGYAVALSRGGRSRRSSVLRGLAIACLLHGTYDFALIATALELEGGRSAGVAIFPILACVVLVGSVGWVVRTAYRLRRGESASAPRKTT